MDPDFGRLLYMHIAPDPAKSYWEAEWLFPPTGTRIAIGLPGTKEGPRELHLGPQIGRQGTG